MESTFFDLDVAATCNVDGISSGTFTIPTLPAYAIEWAEIHINGAAGMHEGKEFRLVGDQMLVDSTAVGYPISQDDSVRLHISYHGIRDYSMLFANVADPDLRKRLGEFYEEADKNFRNGAWLSFALMCGAVFEGILWHKLGNPTDDGFADMIADAKSMDEIDEPTADIMTKVRLFRNLVHAGKFAKPYVSRMDAMDIRTTMDKLIRQVAVRD